MNILRVLLKLMLIFSSCAISVGGVKYLLHFSGSCTLHCEFEQRHKSERARGEEEREHLCCGRCSREMRERPSFGASYRACPALIASSNYTRHSGAEMDRTLPSRHYKNMLSSSPSHTHTNTLSLLSLVV
jgi:hypothetical protein